MEAQNDYPQWWPDYKTFGSNVCVIDLLSSFPIKEKKKKSKVINYHIFQYKTNMNFIILFYNFIGQRYRYNNMYFFLLKDKI